MRNLAIDRLDPALLATTERLAGAVVAAVETGAARVEPSHLLIALARTPKSVAAALFDRGRIPVEAFVEALRAQHPPDAGPPPTELSAETAAPATRDLLAALPEKAGERELLAAALLGLEPAAALLLSAYGRVDIGQWVREIRAEELPAPEVFDGGGRLLPDRFSPGARRALSALAARAGSHQSTEQPASEQPTTEQPGPPQPATERPGTPPPTTALLLHAMAEVPNGLIEQGCRFLGHDVRVLRVQTATLTGAGTGPDTGGGAAVGAQVSPALSRDGVGGPLARTLEKAAAVAARRGAATVAERDLLAALLDTPAGLAAGLLRDTRVDVTRLRRYADDYYQELADPEPEPGQRAARHLPPPPAQALAWMRERLIGRETVIDALTPSLEMISRSLRRGVRLRDQPLGRFLFCGPSGTGKTLTARVLAKAVYGCEDDVLFFEMGQFNSKESMNNFVGAAPGYVGYGEGRLTNGLRDDPRRVLLFDEVEKADGRVLDALLRLLDEGRISDPAGGVCDARDSLIVLTSNLGSDRFAGLGQPGAGAERAADVRRVLADFFRPEFLNRIDEVVLFDEFGQRQLEDIALGGLRRQAAQVTAQLGVALSWGHDVPARIAELAMTRRREEAARGVNRYIEGVYPPLLRLLDEAEERGGRIERALVVVDGERLSVVNGGG